MKENETYSTMKLKDSNGKIKECEILFTFTPKKSNKNYVVYTDNTKDESGALRVFANSYEEKNKKELYPIETEEEWFTIEAILAKFMENKEETK